MRIPVICGPTAVGKTKIAILVAEQLGAEIISCDSRQVYRQLNIGTAKPTLDERASVPHHFVDELDLEEPFSAGIFAIQAENRISEIIERGRVPLVVGGSTLYLHALTHGLAEIPAVDQDIRKELNRRLITEGPEVLFAELFACDPAFAATLDRTKSQRIVRGLEIFLGTGMPLSTFHENQEEPAYNYRLFVLNRERRQLYHRIDVRVDEMIQNGLLQEAQSLSASYTKANIPALNTIGYREIGNLKDDDTQLAVERIKRNSRRYAKRQLTWFRRYADADWIQLSDENAAAVSEQIVQSVRQPATSIMK